MFGTIFLWLAVIGLISCVIGLLVCLVMTFVEGDYGAFGIVLFVVLLLLFGGLASVEFEKDGVPNVRTIDITDEEIGNCYVLAEERNHATKRLEIKLKEIDCD